MSSTGDDLFALARIIVYHATTVDDLARLLAGEALAVAPQGEAWQTTAWRWARRINRWVNGTRPLTLPKMLTNFSAIL
jgi:hypothetical protein